MASDNENTPINDIPPQDSTPEKTAVPPAREVAADKTDEAPKPQRHPRGDRPHREKGEHAKTDGVRAESPKTEPVAPPVAAVPPAAVPPAAVPPAAEASVAVALRPEVMVMAPATPPSSAPAPQETPSVQVGQSPGHHPHAQRQLHPGEQRRKQQQQGKQGGPTLDLVELKDKSILDLNTIAKDMGVLNAAGLRKQELIFKILQTQAEKSGLIFSEGGARMPVYGWLWLPARARATTIFPGPDDAFTVLCPFFADPRRFSDLRTGDTVSRPDPPAQGRRSRYFALIKVDADQLPNPPEEARNKIFFDNLTPLYPDRRLKLETVRDNFSGRVMDLVTPIGKGQRGLIVAPPRTGKTMLLQNIANSVDTTNHPEVSLIVLLIDERPEEVSRTCSAPCAGKSFIHLPMNPQPVTCRLPKWSSKRPRRLVEHKKDVVILLDSITRLARAYNTIVPPSGKVLSGGVDSNALQRPKRFFRSGPQYRRVGGSLTIIATALVDTGSRMDDVIFEEFKGTGNMEIHLDRKLIDKRVFPAIDINKSGTRKEELLMPKDELNRVYILRRVLSPLSPVETMELLLDKLGKTRTNSEFLAAMSG